MADAYDYIIIGAGSSGCVLANRLSADATRRVLLLEAGPPDRLPMLQMPGGMLEVFKHGNYHWQVETSPEKHLHNRQLTLYSGRTLGGSSALNGMLHIRGAAHDYDRWGAQAGCEQWRYDQVLPFFREVEHNARGASVQRGGQGELHATDAPRTFPTQRLVAAFERAAMAQGIPYQADFCAGEASGVGRTQATIKQGRRHSVASAFLKPVRRRANLTVITDALVTAVTINDAVAEGVRYRHRSEQRYASARREVIVCAGALRSPHILQLSGIGDAEALAARGIPVAANVPAVGENLHDHPTLKLHYPCREPISLSGLSRSRQLAIGLQWLLFKSGIGSWHHFDGNLFTRSAPGAVTADLQVQLVPLLAHGIAQGVGDQHGITLVLCLLEELSRGSVRIQSADPTVAPAYTMNFLDQAADLVPLRRGIDLCRRLAADPAWQGMLGAELLPGADIRSEAALDHFIRAQLETDYHYGGTCRMGAIDDPLSVVDGALRVKGVRRLRVADASIMPWPLHGNTNAACVMIGAKLAAALLAEG